MVLTRYSWGSVRRCPTPSTFLLTWSNRYWGAIIPSILNVVTMQGYLVINTIIGGQALAAASSNLDATLGIVIISLISLGVRLLSA